MVQCPDNKRTKDVLHDLIRQYIASGSCIISDGWLAYRHGKSDTKTPKFALSAHQSCSLQLQPTRIREFSDNQPPLLIFHGHRGLEKYGYTHKTVNHSKGTGCPIIGDVEVIHCFI